MSTNVVLGASPNPRRYSYKATEVLSNNNFKVCPVGVRDGEINGIKIEKDYPSNEKIDTLAMYLSPENQESYFDLIFKNLPKRVVFNPGTYNPELQKELVSRGVNVLNDCVLLMVNRGDF